MFKRKYHHNATSDDCAKLCCTKIEHFSAHAGETKIFEDINLHIHCGQLQQLSALMEQVNLLYFAVFWENFRIREICIMSMPKGKHTGHPVIGYVPQYLRFDRTSPTSVMDFFCACLSCRPIWLCNMKKYRPMVLESLARVKAQHLIDRRLGALSGGEMQRVLLSLALNPMPDLLFLDEPVSGVDHNGLKLFYEIFIGTQRKRRYGDCACIA